MTMRFLQIRDGLIDILATAEAGRYRTIGYRERSSSGDENLNNERSVQVWYAEGQFPESAGAVNDWVSHDPQFIVVLSVSKATEVNLTVINNPDSTPAEILAAVALQDDAEFLANSSFDELASIVWETLHDARNMNLGVPESEFYVSNRWVSVIRKQKPTRHGKLVTIVGQIELSCRVEETAQGEPLGNALEIVDNEIDFVGDEVERTGVSVEYP